MRQSLFEKLKSKDLCYFDEVKKINSIIKEDYCLSKYISSEFKISVYNKFYSDYYAAVSEIITPKNHYNFNSENRLSLDEFLDILEFFKTLMIDNTKELARGFGYRQLVSVLDYCCEKLGYQFTYDDKNCYYRVMLKNPEAEAVAINQSESVRDKIYSYLMARQGDIENKRSIIKSLADDIEIMCKKYSNILEYSKLKQFIQCTRHTKDQPKKEFPFYYEDEDKWLDKTFDMIIGVLAFTKTKEIVSEIVDLEPKKIDK